MVNVLTPDLIRQSRADAEASIQAAEAEIAKARLVLSDVEAAERLLARLGNSEVAQDVARTENAQGAREWADNSGNPFRFGTNKAYIWQALRDAKNPWLTANEIQDAIKAATEKEVPMTSISPMLSEMKAEHLERDNMHVALRIRLNGNGEAEASPDADEAVTSSNH